MTAVALITLAGLGLRLYALGHGLPYQYVPDESTMVGGALRMGSARSLQPSTFIYPALLMYGFAAEYLGLLGLGRLTGLFASVAQFREYAFTDPTLFYLLPRLAIALAGTATIPLTYLVGRRLYGAWAGVAAAALVATSVMHVQMSHQARHWVPVSLLAIAILWVSLDLAGRGRGRDYLLSGLLVGLAAAASYNGFLLMALPVAAHVMRWRREEEKGEYLGAPRTPPGTRWERRHPARQGADTAGRAGRPRSQPAPWTRSSLPPEVGEGARDEGESPAPWTRFHLPLVVTLLLAPAVFIVLNPYIVLQFNQFLSFQSDTEHSIGGQIMDQLLGKQGFAFFAEASLAYEPAITLLGIVGAVLAASRFRSTAPLVLLYPVLHYLVFSIMVPSMEQRYMLPALMLWALPAGLAVEKALVWVRERLGGSVPAVAVALVLAALVALPSMRYDWLLSQPDTRTLAKGWIEATLPDGADVAVESYPPPLTPDLDTLRAQPPFSLGNRDQWLLERGLPPGEVAYRLTRLNLVDTSPTVDYLSPYLATHQHRYFVVTDFRWKAEQKGHQALKSYLARDGRLLKAFSPSQDAGYVPSDILNNMVDPLLELWAVERPGPKIEIYEVPR